MNADDRADCAGRHSHAVLFVTLARNPVFRMARRGDSRSRVRPYPRRTWLSPEVRAEGPVYVAAEEAATDVAVKSSTWRESEPELTIVSVWPACAMVAP